MKKFLMLCVSLAILFFPTVVLAGECKPSTATQYKFKGNATGRVLLFLYGTKDNPVYKRGHFWKQELHPSGNRGYCLDMPKDHGKIYVPSEEEFQRVIVNRGYVDESIRILSFDAAVDELLMTASPEIYNKVYPIKENLVTIIAQVASWALVDEGAAGVNPVTRIFSQFDAQKLILSQAYCSVYEYPGIVEWEDTPETSVCTYIPGYTPTDSRQHEEFRTVYESIGAYDEYEKTALGWIIWAWNKATSTKAYNDYIDAYQKGLRKPTIYLPADPDNEQRLLAEYYCDETIESSCWKLETDIPDTCTVSGSSGYVKDIADWNCIFSSVNSSDPSVNKHYIEDSSNEYCQVFCREEVTIELPNNGVQTVQGSYLSVNLDNNTELNNIFPIRYGGEKVCRTTSASTGKINYVKFNNDYLNANNEVLNKWHAYQIAKANEAACLAQTPTKNSGTDANGWYPTNDCKKALINDPADEAYCSDESEKVILSESEKNKAYTKYAEENDMEVDDMDSSLKESLAEDALYTKQSNKYESCMNIREPEPSYCPANNDKWTDFYKERVFSEKSVWYGTYKGTAGTFVQSEKTPNRTHENYCASFTIIANSNYSSYIEAKAKRDNLLPQIKSCITTKRDVSYNTFNPSVNLTYEEETYGIDEGWLLDSKVVSREEGGNLYITGTAVTNRPSASRVGTITQRVTTSLCDVEGAKCTNRVDSYETAEWWEKSLVVVKEYTLPEDVYRFVEKGTGQSVHTANKKSDIEYLDMGFGNLPIHYSSTPNKSYEFTLDTLTYGRLNKFDKYIFGSNQFNGVYYNGEYRIFTCDYKVLCNPMISDNPACPGEPTTGDGLNLVYRTISLYSKEAAFPGLNGQGRTPGANWNDDQLIDTYIVNNRGVRNYSIYTDLDPMYEIELTPGLMKQLRKYNKVKNSTYGIIYEDTNKERNGILGYTDYSDFICDEDGQNCRSELLRGRVSEQSALIVKGCAMSGNNSGYICSAVDIPW